MRLLDRILALAVSLVLLAGILIWASETRPWRALFGGTEVPEATARSSTVYAVGAEDWLTFDLGTRHSAVRVLTNLEIAPTVEIAPDQWLYYALDYRLIDGTGEVAVTRTYHHRSRPRRVERKGHEGTQPHAFYRQRAARPALGQSLVLDLRDHPDVRQLEIRVSDLPSEAVGLVARTYVTSGARADNGPNWSSLGESQRQRLADATTYPGTLLQQRERRNLIAQRWQAVGPTGVPGQDYRSRRLYTWRDVAADPLQPGRILPAGLLVDQARRAVIPIKEADTPVRLSATPLGPSGPTRVRWRWQGTEPEARRSGEATITQATETELREFDPGLLEIVSGQPAALRPRTGSDEAPRDLIPEPSYLRTYRLDGDAPLEIRINHSGGQPTPVRVDLRTLQHAREGPALEQERNVRWALLDAQGNTVASGRTRLLPQLSLYDRLNRAPLVGRVSEAQHFYVDAGPSAQTLRLWSEPAAWAAVYTRPPELRHYTEVPADYHPWREPEHWQPAWYVVRPEGYRKRLQGDSSALLQLQHRPIRRDPDLVDDDFAWKSFSPEGRWHGRRLLVERQRREPVRPEARATSLAAVPANRTIERTLRAQAQARDLRPRLVYHDRAAETPVRVRVHLDGQLLVDTITAGHNGELTLPAIEPGRHRLRIETDREAGNFLLSHTTRASSHRLALAASLADPLVYRIDKPTREALSLSTQLILPASAAPGNVTAHIEPVDRPRNHWLTDWTLARRLFVIDGTDRRAVALAGPNTELTVGETAFLQIGRDLPPGSYRVTFSGPEAGYLRLYNVSGSLREAGRIKRERRIR